MHTENTVFIRGPLARIFQLAADITDWPRILPHYREVRVIEADKGAARKVVEMACFRQDFPLAGLRFPVRWRSVQVCDPQRNKIYFKHLAGIATGMWVVWSLEPDPWGRGVAVTISHDLTYPFGFMNGWFARDLVGRDFVHAIAGRTLETLQAIVEQEPSL